MKTIDLQITLTGRVDDSFAEALERAWARSEAIITLPLQDVTIAPEDTKNESFMTFDFCQPNKLTVRSGS